MKSSIEALETKIAELIAIVSLTDIVVGIDDLNEQEILEDEKLLELTCLISVFTKEEFQDYTEHMWPIAMKLENE